MGGTGGRGGPTGVITLARNEFALASKPGGTYGPPGPAGRLATADRAGGSGDRGLEAALPRGRGQEAEGGRANRRAMHRQLPPPGPRGVMDGPRRAAPAAARRGGVRPAPGVGTSA